MYDFDDGLRRLAQTPTPAKLVDLETAVLVRISGEMGEHASGGNSFCIALVAAALVFGIGAGTLPSREAKARTAIAPLGGASELAPSTLLVGR
ncbi:hypothetical protein E2493_09955 [Sphingomonas parva]|uniref:Uncharacterized protein n=1 Tax=Sphingomonas parva TaxID=2555898 RepID=A0A4Y8ZSH8_9SPHN|nr:hypothetical protein [Sphingomonas parva]TFI58447.1 hypothetical protein E2493_09955 [Sphingomonas parva]